MDKNEHKIDVPVRYIPTFVGWTEEGEKVVLYKNIEKPHELHIKRPDGTLWAVGPGSFVFTESAEWHSFMRLEIRSDPWTGKATGTKRDLIAEPSLTI